MEYTHIKVFNVISQYRTMQNKNHQWNKYLSDDEIKSWIFQYYGTNKDYKIIKRTKIAD